MQKENNLSKNQKIIFDIIDKSGGPMKAYSILFDVQKKGIKAPLQVYRALDKLVELGKIHKIESRNAFIACLLYTSPSPRDQRGSRMPSSA